MGHVGEYIHLRDAEDGFPERASSSSFPSDIKPHYCLESADIFLGGPLLGARIEMHQSLGPIASTKSDRKRCRRQAPIITLQSKAAIVQ